MTKSQQLWLKAARLLSVPSFFDSERERVLADYPLLNSHGLGQLRRHRRVPAADDRQAGHRKMECISENLEAARDELRAGGQHEQGIRNTLEYFVEGRVSLSYVLKGCGWARRFSGPALSKCSSYDLKHEVESYLRTIDKHSENNTWKTENDRYTSNGAFICAALMAGLRIWSYQDSINPDLRLGKPWAVAGLRPEDYSDLDDRRMAKFWRWAVRQDPSDPQVEGFIADTVELLYNGADLEKLRKTIEKDCAGAWEEVYGRLRREFSLKTPGATASSRLGFMAGQIQVPDDFDSMGTAEIERGFGATT